ncbi:adenylate/guanylate cyclase domain-containing protein [Nocardioides sp. CFH 31398]|uniref:adenylate/guanylate cyclase domain-containing protein n=1 Tax=Nocardioides sp. CFH 31398 TaxID=2919579 RepID=UPI001F057464|nr:adenylate/guanylate cyclase domain-containing protein [Nocardioides sp. CFH 31398]MCH1864926.1 adenylate/guanylate cyclase domain-containing protein [Nocardioides sp. CFH 31398]
MTRDLPSGEVTLLFSDIERSTQMVHALGEAWPRVLEIQRRVCREAWQRFDGVELGTQGDSFFVVFASAADAVAAAVRAQRSLAEASWPDDARVRVRIGVHTGTPSRHADGYVGMDVHRAARLAAAGHGGQLLVSGTTMQRVAEALPEGVSAVDLGEHRLRDIPTRTRIHQLTPAGLDDDHPPLRALGGAGSLPTALREGLREVVGRDGEVAELAALVRGGARLLTLTGPGGVGKTTLANAVAASVAHLFGDGVYLVPMVGATSATGMWTTTAHVLGVPPEGQAPPGIFDHLSGRRMLLVLDNLEHLDEADQVVRSLLDGAADVTVVATSRRPLHVAGEHEHVVPVLEPDDAVTMFARHAARARRGFVVDASNRAEVAELCAVLDRLPLALEIAAARVKVLSPRAMLARVDGTLDLRHGRRDADGRQASLRATVAWSHDLLDGPRRSVLDHLGVFLGGASLPGVEAVVPGPDLDGEDLLDVLFDLVDQSMVVVTDTVDGEPRFHLLETVRRFALDRLSERGVRAEAERRHAQFHLDLARDLHPLEQPVDLRTARGTLLLEVPNIGAALARPDADVRWDGHPMPWPHRCALAAEVALEYRLPGDVRRWCAAGLEAFGPGTPDDGLARLGLGWLLAIDARREGMHGDGARAPLLARQAALLVGPTLPEVDSPWRSRTRVMAEAANAAGWSATEPADVEEALRWQRRLVRVAAKDPDPMVAVLVVQNESYLSYTCGDHERTREAILELKRLWAARGWPVELIRENDLSDLDVWRGREDLAHLRMAEHIDRFAEHGDPLHQYAFAQTMAAAVSLAHPHHCVRTIASISVFREVEALGYSDRFEEDEERILARSRPLLGAAEWDAAWRRGRQEPLVDLVREIAALPTPPRTDLDGPLAGGSDG